MSNSKPVLFPLLLLRLAATLVLTTPTGAGNTVPALLGESVISAVIPRPSPTPTAIPTPTPIPRDDVMVSDQPGAGMSQGLIVSGKKIYVAYDTHTPNVYFSRSTDGGQTFSPSVLVAEMAKLPALALSPLSARPQNPGVLYMVMLSQETSTLLFTRSTDEGSTWSSPASISPIFAHYACRIAVDEQGFIYVAAFHQQQSDPRGYYYLFRSTDGGETWSDPLQLNPVPYGCLDLYCLSLVAQNHTLYFTWGGSALMPKPGGRAGEVGQVMFTRSTDQGQTWSPPVQVDDWNSIWGEVAMAVDPSGGIYVAWDANKRPGFETYPKNYVSRSTDGGQTWGPGVRVDDSNACDDRAVYIGSLAFDGRTGSLHLAFRDARNGCTYGCTWCTDVFYSYSTDGGASWSPNEQISDPWDGNIIEGMFGQVQNGILHTVWSGYQEGVGGNDIWLDRYPIKLPPVTPTATPTPMPTVTPTTTPPPHANRYLYGHSHEHTDRHTYEHIYTPNTLVYHHADPHPNSILSFNVATLLSQGGMAQGSTLNSRPGAVTCSISWPKRPRYAAFWGWPEYDSLYQFSFLLSAAQFTA